MPVHVLLKKCNRPSLLWCKVEKGERCERKGMRGEGSHLSKIVRKERGKEGMPWYGKGLYV